MFFAPAVGTVNLYSAFLTHSIDSTLIYRYIADTKTIPHTNMEGMSGKLVLLLLVYLINSTQSCPQDCLCDSGKYTCSFQEQTEIYIESAESATELFISNCYLTNVQFLCEYHWARLRVLTFLHLSGFSCTNLQQAASCVPDKVAIHHDLECSSAAKVTTTSPGELPSSTHGPTIVRSTATTVNPSPLVSFSESRENPTTAIKTTVHSTTKENPPNTTQRITASGSTTDSLRKIHHKSSFSKEDLAMTCGLILSGVGVSLIVLNCLLIR